jgi:hypothetical protein
MQSVRRSLRAGSGHRRHGNPHTRADVLPVSGHPGHCANGTIDLRLDRIEALATRLSGAVSLRDHPALGGAVRVGRATPARCCGGEALGDPGGTWSAANVAGLWRSARGSAARSIALTCGRCSMRPVRGRLARPAPDRNDHCPPRRVTVPELQAEWGDAVVAASGRAALDGAVGAGTRDGRALTIGALRRRST